MWWNKYKECTKSIITTTTQVKITLENISRITTIHRLENVTTIQPIEGSTQVITTTSVNRTPATQVTLSSSKQSTYEPITNNVIVVIGCE